MIETDKFDVKITCTNCGSDAEISLEDDGACGNPKCCGPRSYWLEIRCSKCNVVWRSDF